MDEKAIQQQAAAIARKAYMVKPGQVSDRYRVRIPEEMHQIIDRQSPGDRGSNWAMGVWVASNIDILWKVLEHLSGCAASVIVDEDLTLVVGQNTFTGEHQVEVLFSAIAHYLPEGELDLAGFIGVDQMKYEYLVARGLLLGAKDDTIFAPTIAGQKLKQWEGKPLQDFLNHYGEDGWELVNVFSPRTGDGFCLVFKRTKEGQ